MRRLLCSFLIFAASPLAAADDFDITAIVETHVVPRYEMLAGQTQALAREASVGCSAAAPDTAPGLLSAYHAAFDAWVGVGHLRFGPSEQDDRAFALAFWPDPRGSTPKALAGLVKSRDAAVNAPDEFAEISVAARGFYALEFLLFDAQFAQPRDAAYRCALIQAVTKDISSNAAAILAGWQNGYGALMSNPGNDTYRTPAEAAKQLFTALSTGLEFTSLTRLGRPMGTYDRPRPNRAEARRSERSLRHVLLSLAATRELTELISAGNEAVDKAFADAIQRAEALDDPTLAGVADPQGRFRVEVLQQSIDVIRRILSQEIGPELGIAAGFNSLDGD
ncbi:imelysin family protein [Candidatus Rhodobacter oscarellae]|nr:imelysin family protein [Candidatus Rhodobacter lobularis]